MIYQYYLLALNYLIEFYIYIVIHSITSTIRTTIILILIYMDFIYLYDFYHSLNIKLLFIN